MTAGRWRAALWAAAVAAAALAAPAPPLSAEAHLFVSARTGEARAAEHAVIALVNAHRARRGLGRLRESLSLVRAARAHSEFMRRTNLLSHRGFRGSSFVDRLRAIGYRGTPRAENVAYGYPTADQVFSGWLTSAGHRRNIELADIDEIGVGRVVDPATGIAWWTMVVAAAGPGRRGE